MRSRSAAATGRGGVMEYVVLKREDIDDLENVVNKWICDGYTPQGGVFCVVVPEDCFVNEFSRCSSTRLHFYQAMVKRKAKGVE